MLHCDKQSYLQVGLGSKSGERDKNLMYGVVKSLALLKSKRTRERTGNSPVPPSPLPPAAETCGGGALGPGRAPLPSPRPVWEAPPDPARGRAARRGGLGCGSLRAAITLCCGEEEEGCASWRPAGPRAAGAGCGSRAARLAASPRVAFKGKAPPSPRRRAGGAEPRSSIITNTSTAAAAAATAGRWALPFRWRGGGRRLCPHRPPPAVFR